MYTQQETGARERPRFAFAIAITIAASGWILVASDSAYARPAAGRVMPPSQLTCPPNQLTSYFGKVTGYKRGKTSTWLRIATDYDTVEEVTAPHARYLYQRAPFGKKDWSRIESKTGVLRPGTRATAWVCSDGKTPPVVDWNAAAE